MYTVDELEAAVKKATSAENRMTACETNVKHIQEDLVLVREEMTSGFTSVRQVIARNGRNGGAWRRPTIVVAGSSLVGAGGLIYYIVDILKG